MGAEEGLALRLAEEGLALRLFRLGCSLAFHFLRYVVPFLLHNIVPLGVVVQVVVDDPLGADCMRSASCSALTYSPLVQPMS